MTGILPARSKKVSKQPSKNSRCPCGSGKKYRKCCRRKAPPLLGLDKITEIFRKKEDRREKFIERYGHARPAVSAEMEGRVWTVVGGAIYQQTQEGLYNFVNAVHDHALHFFGDDYLDREERKPFGERNPAIQWMQSYVDYMEGFGTKGADTSRFHPIGVGAAWIRFAYDLFTIRDNAKIAVRLKERILSNKDFQSARHELWVAALFISANFDLEFEDESDTTGRHPEFIAVDRESSARLAVEAKSRHRRGVKGFTRGTDMIPGHKVDIRGLVMEAYKKSRLSPLYVFIDVNLPPVADEKVWQRWIYEIDMTMSDLAAEGYADLCPANIVFFSNDPSHYVGMGKIGNKSDQLWMKYYGAKSPRVAHPQTDVCGRLMKAYEQRRSPPGDFPDFN